MTSSVSFHDFDQVVAAIEDRIQAAIAHSMESAPTIRCRFQQGRLLVLAEDAHTAATAAERSRRFKALARSLNVSLLGMDLPPAWHGQKGWLPVRFYLRQQGNASPYAARNWQWKPAAPPPPPRRMGVITAPHAADAAVDEGDEAMPGGALVVLSAPTDTQEAVFADSFSPEPTETVGRSSLLHHWQVLAEQVGDWPWRSLLGLMTVGVAVGGITYAMTRPCLIGSCDRRQTASDLSQSALSHVAGKPTLQDINTAHRDLQQAVTLLAGIPPWSPHYNTAQAELLRYRTQLADLEWIMAAQEHAAAAAAKSQDPPHPVAVWVEVHLLWQKAVTNLQRIPADSAMAAFAALKLQEYEANYEAIGQRLTVEEQAEANLNDAIAAGQKAEAMTANATTLAEWVIVQRDWQRAVASLSRIPKGTLAYEEASSFREDYRIQLVRARMRVSVEQAGARAYDTGLTYAADAQAAERANQWTRAVQNWRQAVSAMRQVPADIPTHAEAQNALQLYQASLERAEGQLQKAIALQDLSDDLAVLCPPGEGICSFSYTVRQVDLVLAEPYDSAIRQSISAPSDQTGLSESTAVVERTHQLVQDIMQLGNRIGLPIAIYDPNRQFIARYMPEYGGFTK